MNYCSEEGKQELTKINLTFQSRQSLALLDIEKFSSWRRLLRVIAWIMRFISNSKRSRIQNSQETGNKQSNTKAETLESEEISNAEKYRVRETQSERFLDELTTVRGGGSISQETVRCRDCHHFWTVMESYVWVADSKRPTYLTMPNTLLYYRRNITFQDLSSPTSTIKDITSSE